jgi:hypothetical protein
LGNERYRSAIERCLCAPTVDDRSQLAIDANSIAAVLNASRMFGKYLQKPLMTKLAQSSLPTSNWKKSQVALGFSQMKA